MTTINSSTRRATALPDPDLVQAIDAAASELRGAFGLPVQTFFDEGGEQAWAHVITTKNHQGYNGMDIRLSIRWVTFSATCEAVLHAFEDPFDPEGGRRLGEAAQKRWIEQSGWTPGMPDRFQLHSVWLSHRALRDKSMVNVPFGDLDGHFCYQSRPGLQEAVAFAVQNTLPFVDGQFVSDTTRVRERPGC